MLTQLALDLKDRNLSDGMLVKLVLINISAQNYSLVRAPSMYWLMRRCGPSRILIRCTRDEIILSPSKFSPPEHRLIYNLTPSLSTRAGAAY